MSFVVIDIENKGLFYKYSVYETTLNWGVPQIRLQYKTSTFSAFILPYNIINILYRSLGLLLVSQAKSRKDI